MKNLSVLALLVVLAGCDPAPSTEVTASNANPLAKTASTSTPDAKAPEKAPDMSAPGATPAEMEAKVTKPAQSDVSTIVNPDGKADAGLPATAAPGAKTPKTGDDIATLTTAKGEIVVRFFPGKAPLHVANFLKLAKSGFYDGTRFHRVIPGFMIQGGDPNTKGDDRSSWGGGGPDEKVKAEFNDVPHTRGILSMARTQDPDSAGSQFFIIHKKSNFLDGQYSVFGQVLKGMDVVDKIVSVPTEGDQAKDPVRLTKVTVAKWPVKL